MSVWHIAYPFSRMDERKIECPFSKCLFDFPNECLDERLFDKPDKCLGNRIGQKMVEGNRIPSFLFSDREKNVQLTLMTSGGGA